jgi:hypothetical protein
MAKIDPYEKLNVPGIWFVCSKEPANQLSRYVYDLAVELGLPVVVYSNSTKKEIQNEVLGFIKAKCIEAASDELERNWLEQEMMEYNNHGFFFYPEELNDYVPNGSFWTNYVFFDEFKILSFTNSFSKIYLIENLSDLWYNNECDIFQSLHSIEKEAIEYKKTIIVFISSANSRINETYINNHLLLNK